MKNETKTTRLYRAAKDDAIVGTPSFARRIEDAREYMDNPSFGGGCLYSADVETPRGSVLDLTDAGSMDEQLSILAAKVEMDYPGATTADVWVQMDPMVSERLLEAGYLWLVVTDTYPVGCETWVWLGSMDADEPTLTEI